MAALEDWGFTAKLLSAGFAGGVVHVFVFKQTDARAVVGSILTGTLTANFLAPAASHYIGNWLGDGGTAFIVGLSAMVICQGIVFAIRSKFGNATSGPAVKDKVP